MTYGSPIPEITGVDARRFREDVLAAARPVVMRGLAGDWPAVRAGEAAGGAAAYLAGLDGGASCTLLEGPPGIGGRFFYNQDLTGFNFTRSPSTLRAALARLHAASRLAAPPALAVQAVSAREMLPGFCAENPAPLLEDAPDPRLWIGNRVVVAIHHDLSRNLAVCVAGRRRFTLFPPERMGDLYVGPFEFSPAGPPVSMVDGAAPDLARHPRFAAAMGSAQTAQLEPGDAIYIPYMWWHQVESLDSFSVLANYWWNETPPPQPGLAPMDVLTHARLAFSALSPEQRAAWRSLFDHVVFEEAGDAAHLPENRRGIRGRITGAARTHLRRQLGSLLSR